jgi:lipid-A-disaccharide synthase
MIASGQRIGILAGAGSLPLQAAEIVTRRGGSVHVVMVDGLADAALTAYPHTIVNWAQLGRALAAFKAAGVRDVVMLGATGRPSFANARPDWGFISALPAVLRLLKAGGDDAVLRGLIGLFDRHGFNVVGVSEVAPEMTIAAGPLTVVAPSASDAADARIGFDLISALGRFDIGQATIVSDGRIEAIEAAEGTDRMLKRVAERRREAGAEGRHGVLVKLPKPGQDLRVDLPTIGASTIANVAEAGLAGVAAMTGHALVAERAKMTAAADAHGLFVTGENATPAAPRVASASGASVLRLGRVPVGARTAVDIERAAAILEALSAFATGSAVVIDHGRVIAVGAGEPAGEVVARVAALRGGKMRGRGVVVLAAREAPDVALVAAAHACGLAGVASPNPPAPDALRLADERGLFIAAINARAIDTDAKELSGAPLKIFLVAGEHSGDALGAKLMAALKTRHGGPIEFAGVGGEEMAHEGFHSLFPIEDVAVMGPLSILPKLPRIVRRVYQTVDAALAFSPDVVVIVDSPEFTHPIAKRIRKRAPGIPIVDYVSPSVWAWRPGRAKKMRAYVDHVLALLPFEPEAHARLGGPPCTYVGHSLVEKLGDIQGADSEALARRLGLPPGRPVLLVLPGSRTSEVTRLIDIFGDTVGRVAQAAGGFEVVIPAVRHVRELIVAKTAGWAVRPHIVDGADDKYAAMRLARAALAASGTVTLELAIVGTPSVVAYRTDNLSGKLMFLIKVPSVVLANLVLGKNVYPEFLQDNCTAEKLTAALIPLLVDTDARREQLAELTETASKLRPAAASPSLAAADVVLSVVADQAAGKSRRGGPI